MGNIGVGQLSSGVGGVAGKRTRVVYFERAARIAAHAAPDTRNRSWLVIAEIRIPIGGARGPIMAMGGSDGGWALYLKTYVPTFCYNAPGPLLTHVRAAEPLGPGLHVLRYEFEKLGLEPLGAGGIGRLYVDDELAGQAAIPWTCGSRYAANETFDIACDTGTLVTEEYRPLPAFTGEVIRVEFHLECDVPPLPEEANAQGEPELLADMIRQPLVAG